MISFCHVSKKGIGGKKLKSPVVYLMSSSRSNSVHPSNHIQFSSVSSMDGNTTTETSAAANNSNTLAGAGSISKLLDNLLLHLVPSIDTDKRISLVRYAMKILSSKINSSASTVTTEADVVALIQRKGSSSIGSVFSFLLCVH
jgi:hypothetical protein